MKAGNEFATKLIEALDEQGLPWREYSGRGMYGEYCVAVTCGGNRGCDEEEVLEAVKMVPRALRASHDSLGMGTIMYWPGAVLDKDEPKVPYPEFCRHKDKCAGLSCCPEDPTCAD